MSHNETRTTDSAGPLSSEELGLSPDVQELLRERDMYAAPAYTGRTDLLLVRDEEGTALFQVTPAIGATDLRLLLAYAWKMHQTGVRIGQEEAQGRMRRALGIE